MPAGQMLDETGPTKTDCHTRATEMAALDGRLQLAHGCACLHLL